MAQTPDRVALRAPRHLVVLANPSATSFDRSIVDVYREVAAEHRQEVEVRDLYGLRPDQRPLFVHPPDPLAQAASKRQP